MFGLIEILVSIVTPLLPVLWPFMLYRLYNPEDFAALYAIEEICFQPPFRFPRDYMRRLVTARDAATWIAEEGGGMAGFAIVAWNEHDSGITAYIETIEVVPEFRSRGIGAALLQRVEASARSAEASALWLHVDITNAPAIRLYERHGFTPRGSEEHFYAPGRGAHIYAKDLTPVTQE